jgi:type IV secretion system protein TrbI
MANPMSSQASPDVVPTRAGVRRVNNLPIFIVVGIMLVFLLTMMIVAMNRANQQHQTSSDDNSKAGSSHSLAQLITGEFEEGVIEPSLASIDAIELQQQDIMIARPNHLDVPPLPPGGQKLADEPITPDNSHIYQMKMQLFEEAVKAKTNVTMVASRSAGSAPSNNNTQSDGTPSREEALARISQVRQQFDTQREHDPSRAYQAQMQQMRSDGLMGNGGFDANSAPYLLDTESNHRPNNDYSQFAAKDGTDRWRMDSKPVSPQTSYSLLTGFVIPAILISGINSDLPGQIMAQVSEDVYDTPIGRWRLIPQGSRLVGSYSNDVAFGQRRVLVAWQRLIFPDGKTMDIGEMPGADGNGQAGFNDQVNNHYARLFGAALLMSAVVAGVTYSQRDSGGNFGRQNAGSIMSQALGQQLGQATLRLMMRNLNIAPTLEIRPGYRFNIVVTKDMVFNKPYQAFN